MSKNQQVSTGTNPYFDLKPILSSDKLIDLVFKKSMKAASTGNLGISPLVKTRRTEAKRVLVCAKLFRDRLNEIVFQFPNLDEIPKFYLDTIEIMVGLDKLRKTLGSISGATNVIWKIYREQTSIIWHSTVFEAKKARRSAVSRYASIIKKLNTRFEELEEIRLQLRKLPVFSENPIFVIAGFPNVGKSSFLRSLTNANPEVAEYPFTTKKVSIGHYINPQSPFITWQIVDTPGILDRPFHQRNEIEKKTFAAIMNLPSLVIFLFDPTQIDTFNEQLNLFKELKSNIDVQILFIVNKTDLLNDDEKIEVSKRIRSYLNIEIDDIIYLQANDKSNSTTIINLIIKTKFKVE